MITQELFAYTEKKEKPSRLSVTGKGTIYTDREEKYTINLYRPSSKYPYVWSCSREYQASPDGKEGKWGKFTDWKLESVYSGAAHLGSDPSAELERNTFMTCLIAALCGMGLGALISLILKLIF